MKTKNIIITLVVVIIVIAGIFVLTRSSGSSQTVTGTPDTTSQQSVSDVTSSSPSSSSGALTMAVVAEHNSATSCYTAINGSVYDLTNWIHQHPGGQQPILSLCGTDGTAAFTAQHGGQARPEQELATFKIGTLSQ